MNSTIITSTARHGVIRYTLFDLDTGHSLGDIQMLVVDLFTSNPFEIFCRLKDFLTYSLGMHFSQEQIESCFAEHHPEDEHIGDSYLAIGTWHKKEFGIQFTLDN